MINSLFIFLSRRLRRLIDAAKERQEANKKRLRLVNTSSVMLVSVGDRMVLKFLNRKAVKKKEKRKLRLNTWSTVMFIGDKNKSTFKFLN